MNYAFWKKKGDRLGFLTLALLCTVAMGFFLHHNWVIKEKSHYSEHQAILDTAYRASVQMYHLAMESFFDNTLNTSQVLDIFAAGADSQGKDRDLARGKLYRLLFHSYESMKRQNLLQLHFHLADGTSFLRFHQPERSGDPLFESRPDILICNTEQRIVHGFEQGKVRSGFRYVFPLTHHGRHLGSVEVGVSVKAMLAALEELDPKREYAYVLSRQLAESDLFPEQQWLYSPAAIHNEYLVEDANAVLPDSPSPLSGRAKALNELLRARPDVQRAMHQGEALTVSESRQGPFHTVSLMPLRGAGNRLSGYLITYAQDPFIAQFRREYLLISLYALGALALIFTLLWRLRVRTLALDTERRNLEAMNIALAEGVYVENSEGIIIRVNPAACQLLGYTEEEMTGQEAHALFHRHPQRGAIPREDCPFSQIIRTGKAYNGEELFLTKAGRMIMVEAAIRPIMDAGNLLGSITAFHDITERKETEAALRRSEETGRKMMLAVEQSPASVVITDAQGTIEYVNAKFIQKSGYSFAEAVGQNPKILKSGLIPETVYNNLWKTISSGHEWKGELHNKRKDDSLYWESVSISPIRNPEGEITHFIAMKEDITDRMRMEEELRENEMIQRTLMASMPVGLVIIDARTRIIEQVNPSAAALFGLESAAIVGNRCHHFLCPADESSCPISDLGQTVDNSDRVMIRADGTRIPVLKTVKTISLKGREKLLECFVDIRERKKSEDALREVNRQLELAIASAERQTRRAEEANQAKSSFLANMSHEIRTPMNAVLGMMHLTLRTELTSQQRDFLNKAEHSAKSLLSILNGILDFSKVEAGQLDLERVEFELHDVLDHLITIITSHLQGKDIEFIAGVSRDVPTRLWGDPFRLGQVLINLAGNAAKFTESGEVRVLVGLDKLGPEKQARLRFDVFDTGMGMNEEQIARLFTPFTQADASFTRQYGGTGLGLSISQRLVRLMGGDIRVESTVHQGSLFSFDVLLDVADTLLQPVLPPDLRGKRALVADDNTSSREALIEYLLSLGMVPDAAASGSEAISILRAASESAPFALVFLDQEMPGMDGITAFHAITADPRIEPKPQAVLLATLQADRSLSADTTPPFVAILQKPVSLNVLIAELQQWQSESGDGFREAPAAIGSRESADPRFTGGRVLLVEDNAFNQMVAQGILKIAGLEVVVAGDGLEAVALAGTESFDIILMDIQMPEMDGLEATRRIRQLPGGQTLPIIAMTAYATPEEREQILAAGMDEHMAKPIDSQSLFTVLSRWLTPDRTKGAGAGNIQALAAAAPIETPAADTQTGSASLAPHSPELLAHLEHLIPALHSCKPKQCKIILERLGSLILPRQETDQVRKINEHLRRYEFTEALELAQAWQTELGTLRDQQ